MVHHFRVAVRDALRRMAERYEGELPAVSAVAERLAVLYAVGQREGFTTEVFGALRAVATVYAGPEARVEALAAVWLADPAHLTVAGVVSLYRGTEWAHDPEWYAAWVADLHDAVSDEETALLIGLARVLGNELHAPWKRYGASVVSSGTLPEAA